MERPAQQAPGRQTLTQQTRGARHGGRSWGRGVALIVVAGLVMLTAGCTDGPETATRPDPVVTQEEATRAVEQVWQERRAAIATGETDRLSALETGTAAVLSAALTRAGDLTEPAPLRDVRVHVPRQAAFPVTVVAVGTTDDPDRRPDRQLLAVTRETAEGPWQLAWSATLRAEIEQPEFWADADGYAELPHPQQRLRLPAPDATRRLTDDLRRLSAGAIPMWAGSFTAGPFTSGAAMSVQRTVRDNQADGDEFRVTWHPAAEPTIALRTANGGVLLLTAVERRTEETLHWRNGLVQDEDRTQLHPDIPPGRWSRLDMTRLGTYSLYLPPAGGYQRAVVTGTGTSPVISAEAS